jgi:hypothetical protein
MGIEDGIQIDSAPAFDAWLAGNGASERELWAIIYKKNPSLPSSGIEAVQSTR